MPEPALPAIGIERRAGFIEPVDLAGVILVVLLKKPDLVHESSGRDHGERAAAEAEEIEFVARLVIVDEEPVKSANVLLDPLSECSSRQLVPLSGSSNSVVVIDDLIGSRARSRQDGARSLEHVGGLRAPRPLVLSFRLIPSAIGAEDDAFHRPLPGRRVGPMARRPRYHAYWPRLPPSPER